MRSKLSRAHSFVGLNLSTACLTLFVAVICVTADARADQNGVSFWIPGFFGSLAATPQQPGWSITSLLYNTNVSASGNTVVSREITIGELPKTTVNISGSANVHADATDPRQDTQTRQAAAAGRHRAAGGRFGTWPAAGRSKPLDGADAGEGGERELALGAAHP